MTRIQRAFSIFVFYSLLIHLSVGFALYFWPKTGNLQNESLTEVEFLIEESQDEALKRQIVEQVDQVNDEIPEDSQFLSAFNQKVVRETKAAKTGEFKNSDTDRGDLGQFEKAPAPAADDMDQKTSNPPEQSASAKDKTLAKKIDLKDLAPKLAKIEDLADLSAQGVRGEASQTDDHLSEVETGLQTLLSSREFVYYAYYARIKERIRQYWIPTVKQKIKIVQRSGREIASSKDRITQVVVVLNRHGELVGVQIVGPSGVHDLDQAAVEAFQSAAPFPNPPQGMVEPDGFIRIRWDFVLEA